MLFLPQWRDLHEIFIKIIIRNYIIYYLDRKSFAETTISEEGQYIFNSLAFYIGGVLVAFYGSWILYVRKWFSYNKSVSTIAAKNIGKFAICSLVFFLVGYNLAYGIPEGGYIGSFSPWSDGSEVGTGYSDSTDWFFQTMFVCATASIVSVKQLLKELKFGHFLFLLP